MQALAEARKASADILEEIASRKEEAERALEAIRETSVAAGVAHHADVFKDAAARHEKQAKTWGRWALASGIATMLAAALIVWLWDTNGDLSDASVLQVVLLKGLVVVSGVLLDVDRHQDIPHLVILNRHREDALRTYRAFAEGTETSDVKDRVLLAAAHAIFGFGSTGLIEGQEGLEPSQLLGLLSQR